MPNFVSFAASVAELAHREKSRTQSLTHPAYLMPRELKRFGTCAQKPALYTAQHQRLKINEVEKLKQETVEHENQKAVTYYIIEMMTKAKDHTAGFSLFDTRELLQ